MIKTKKQFPIFAVIICSFVVGEWNRSFDLCAQVAKHGSTSLFRRTGMIESKKISESSGVAFSSYDDERFWTINDSGQDAELYYLSQTGKLLGELTLTSARNEDWEAMGAFKFENVHNLLVADVGDNDVNRANCQLYIFPEPKINPKKKKAVQLKLTPQKIVFRYVDGARNCEAVAVDPQTLDLWLVEKIFLDSDKKHIPGIYVLPLIPLLADGNVKVESPADDVPPVAQRIGDFPIRNVTGMDFSPDGKRLIIRNYLNAHLYQRVEGKSWRETIAETQPIPVPLPLQLQGEAIGFSNDSKSLLVTSENASQPIWMVDLEAYLAKRKAAKN